MGRIETKGILIVTLLMLFILPVLIGTVFEDSSFNSFDLTGLFVKDRDIYFDYLGKSYDSDSVVLWIPDEQIKIEGLALSGNATGTGYFQANLIYEDKSYLIAQKMLNDETI